MRDKNSIRRAREMRKDMTSAEAKLWSLLRDRRLIKRKFRRQHPIGPWIADFACPAIHLVIEVDGPSHDDPDQQAYDAIKEEYLRANGWRILRVKNDDVYQAFGEVEAISLLKLETSPSPGCFAATLSRATGEGTL